MHLNSELLFKKYAIPYFGSNIRVLEVGPTGFPTAYQNLVGGENRVWETIDFASTTYIGASTDKLTYHLTSPYNFPIDDNTYDIVISGQVIEHVEKIWTWLKEIKRITREGGYIILINPVSWPYHEAPVDCWRIFPRGISALSEEVDLTVLECYCESLEIPQILLKDPKSKFIPGESYNYQGSIATLNRLIKFNQVIRQIPFLKNLERPIEVAYDTISILKK
jgi:SAM-dependent methyltransferase